MNTYRKSDGSRITQKTLDQKIRKAKAELLQNQIDEFGYNFCTSCKKSTGVILDCAHAVSVQRCKMRGQTEIAYDVNNMAVLCRDCHKEYDNLTLKFTK